MKTIVVNLIGAAGSGKSTLAAEVFYRLKKKGVNCEYVTEYAKGIVYEENYNRLQDQLLVLSNQYHSINMLQGKVNVVITDSPLLVSIFYNQKFTKSPVPYKLFEELVMYCYSTSDNMNYFITRNHEYKQEGRYQDESTARKQETEMKNMIKGLGVDCKYLISSDNCADIIINDVEKRLEFVKDLEKSSNEIERKFILKEFPSGISCKGEKIEQAYILAGEREVRIRNVDNLRFYLTEKMGNGLIRQEYEKEILKDDCQRLLKLSKGRVIHKTRYHYPIKENLIAEIDCYEGKQAGLKTVEVEFSNINDAENFKPPVWFGEEITDNKKYKNIYLAIENCMD